MMRHQNAPPLILLLLMIAFPQLNETLFSPALPSIATHFHVTASAAQWMVSTDLFAFAFGMVCWGRVSDQRGRRPALLAALVCYVLGAILTWGAPIFIVLLLARALMMFGASAGSVVIQTMLRDLYQGSRLAAVYSLAAGTLALSAAVGPPVGSLLVGHHGIDGLFAFLCGFALMVLLVSMIWGHETKPETGTSNAGYAHHCREIKHLSLPPAVQAASRL